MTGKVTPAEAKAVWDSLDKPSCRKVSDKFKAAGRSISFKTVAEWKREGWGAKTAEEIEAGAAKSVEKIDIALPVLTGNVTSKLDDVGFTTVASEAAPAQTVTAPAQSITSSPQSHNEPLSETTAQAAKPAEPDTRTGIERAEDALLKAITGATTVWDGIRDLMAGTAPEGKAIPPMLLAAQPEGIAKLMLAASAAITSAIEDSKQIPFLRAEAAAAIPGTQTMYPPGQGPHAAGEDYPLRSAMESFDAELKRIRERKS